MCGDKFRAWRPRKEELPVLLAVFLFFTGDLMMLYTAFPYTTYAVCIDTFPNATASHCLTLHTRPEQEEAVTGKAALLFMTEKMVGPIPSLILAAILAPWSDLHGRRLPLLITCLGACLATILFLLTDWLRHVSVVAIVMTGFLVRAMTGQGFIFRLMAYSYTADWINSEIQQEEKGQTDYVKIVEADVDQDATDLSTCTDGEKKRHPFNSDPFKPTAPSTRMSGGCSGAKGVQDPDSVKEMLLMRSMSRLQAAESLAVVSGTAAAWGIQLLASAPVSLCVSSAIHLMAALVIMFKMGDVATWRQVTKNVTENSAAATCDVRTVSDDTECKGPDAAPHEVTNNVTENSGTCNRDVCAVSGDVVHKCPDSAWHRATQNVTKNRTSGTCDMSAASHDVVCKCSNSSTKKCSFDEPPIPNCHSTKENTTKCFPSYGTTAVRYLSEDPILYGADQQHDFTMQNRSRNKQSKLSHLKNKVHELFVDKLQAVLGNGMEVDRKYMWGSFLTTLVLMGCLQGRAAIVMAFVQRAPLSWPNEYLSAFAGVCSATTSFFLFFLAPCMRDNLVIVLGLVCSVGGTLWMMFPSSTLQMMVAGSLSQMADCVLPAVKAILSKKVDKEHVGKVLSRLTAAEAFACMLGPLTLVTVYYATAKNFPGASFLTSAVLTTLVLVTGVVVVLHGKVRRFDRREVACVLYRADSERTHLLDKSRNTSQV